MKFVLGLVAITAAREQELLSIGEKMAQLRQAKGNVEFDPLTGEPVVRSSIGVKDPFPFGTMEMHSNEAQWQTDAPAGYVEHMDEVPHPADEAVQVREDLHLQTGYKEPVPIGILLQTGGSSLGLDFNTNHFPYVGPYGGEADEDEPWRSRIRDTADDELDAFKEMLGENTNEDEYKETNALGTASAQFHDTTWLDMPKPAYAESVGFTA